MHKMKYFMEYHLYLFVARKLDGSNLSKTLEFPLTIGVVLQTKGHPNELGTPIKYQIIQQTLPVRI